MEVLATAVLTSSHSVANHPPTQKMCPSASANIIIAPFTIGAPGRIEVVQYHIDFVDTFKY